MGFIGSRRILKQLPVVTAFAFWSMPVFASDMNAIVALVGFLPLSALLSAVAVVVLMASPKPRLGFSLGAALVLVGLLNLYGGWTFLSPTHLYEELSSGTLDNEVMMVGALVLPVVLSVVVLVKNGSRRAA